MGLFSIFYTFSIYCVTTGVRKKPIECMVCFIYCQHCIIIILSRKMCGFISSVFKENIPNNTTHNFQEVGGVTQPHIICWWHKNFSWYRANHHIMDWFLPSRCFYFYLFATVFNWNKPERQRIAELILPMGRFLELSTICSGLQDFFWL